MKKMLVCLLVLLSLCVFGAAAEEIDYVEVPLDSQIVVSGDFSAKYVMNRDGFENLDGGLMFYLTDNSYLGFSVRRYSDDRIDLYGTKFINGMWAGFLIPEEYQDTKKDGFVSIDEGWDATPDRDITVTIVVKDRMATVTVAGDVTGQSGTLHFDLDKSAYRDFEDQEANPLVLTEGPVFFSYVTGGQATHLYIDSTTYNRGQTASLINLPDTTYGFVGSKPPVKPTEYVEVPLDSRIAVSGNFSAKYVMNREGFENLDGGLMFYQTGDSYLGFSVRRYSPDRIDLYGTKFVDGMWAGFLIPEEYQDTKKDGFVSVDEGWDATPDQNITVTIVVEGTMATVTVEGDVTGKSGTLHFDLTKSAWLNGTAQEQNPLLLTEGPIFFSYVTGGQATHLYVDSDTYNHIQPQSSYEANWYPHNTLCVAGIEFRDAKPEVTNKWYNFAALDLTEDGVKMYDLVASNMFVVGKVIVSKNGDELLIDWKLNRQGTNDANFQLEDEFMTLFSSLDAVTELEPENYEGPVYEFGQPISIQNDLGGDPCVLLYIRNVATYFDNLSNGCKQPIYHPRYAWGEDSRIRERNAMQAILDADPVL